MELNEKNKKILYRLRFEGKRNNKLFLMLAFLIIFILVSIGFYSTLRNPSEGGDLFLSSIIVLVIKLIFFNTVLSLVSWKPEDKLNLIKLLMPFLLVEPLFFLFSQGTNSLVVSKLLNFGLIEGNQILTVLYYSLGAIIALILYVHSFIKSKQKGIIKNVYPRFSKISPWLIALFFSFYLLLFMYPSANKGSLTDFIIFLRKDIVMMILFSLSFLFFMVRSKKDFSRSVNLLGPLKKIENGSLVYFKGIYEHLGVKQDINAPESFCFFKVKNGNKGYNLHFDHEVNEGWILGKKDISPGDKIEFFGNYVNFSWGEEQIGLIYPFRLNKFSKEKKWYLDDWLKKEVFSRKNKLKTRLALQRIYKKIKHYFCEGENVKETNED